MKPFKIYRTLPGGGMILCAEFTTIVAAEMALKTLRRAELKYPKWLRAVYEIKEKN